jgi:hypothetical protein
MGKKTAERKLRKVPGAQGQVGLRFLDLFSSSPPIIK